jgi:hypothetical protein
MQLMTVTSIHDLELSETRRNQDQKKDKMTKNAWHDIAGD